MPNDIIQKEKIIRASLIKYNIIKRWLILLLLILLILFYHLKPPSSTYYIGYIPSLILFNTFNFHLSKGMILLNSKL